MTKKYNIYKKSIFTRKRRAAVLLNLRKVNMAPESQRNRDLFEVDSRMYPNGFDQSNVDHSPSLGAGQVTHVPLAQQTGRFPNADHRLDVLLELRGDQPRKIRGRPIQHISKSSTRTVRRRLAEFGLPVRVKSWSAVSKGLAPVMVDGSEARTLLLFEPLCKEVDPGTGDSVNGGGSASKSNGSSSLSVDVAVVAALRVYSAVKSLRMMLLVVFMILDVEIVNKEDLAKRLNVSTSYFYSFYKEYCANPVKNVEGLISVLTSQRERGSSKSIDMRLDAELRSLSTPSATRVIGNKKVGHRPVWYLPYSYKETYNLCISKIEPKICCYSTFMKFIKSHPWFKPYEQRTCLCDRCNTYFFLNRSFIVETAKSLISKWGVSASFAASYSILFSEFPNLSDASSKEQKADAISKYLMAMLTSWTAHVYHFPLNQNVDVSSHCIDCHLGSCSISHPLKCDLCSLGWCALNMFELLVFAAPIRDQLKLFLRCKMIADQFEMYIGHRVRASIQRAAVQTTHLSKTLPAKHSVMIIDYKQKILPKLSFETQKDYFGKAGMSLLGCMKLFRLTHGDMQKEFNFCPAGQRVAQNAATTADIVFYMLRNCFPAGIKSVDIVSDGARNFQCYEMMERVNNYNNWAEIFGGPRIANFRFFETGEGKSELDANFAGLGSYYNNYPADVRTTKDLEKCLGAFLDKKKDVGRGGSYLVTLKNLEEVQKNTITSKSSSDISSRKRTDPKFELLPVHKHIQLGPMINISQAKYWSFGKDYVLLRQVGHPALNTAALIRWIDGKFVYVPPAQEDARASDASADNVVDSSVFHSALLDILYPLATTFTDVNNNAVFPTPNNLSSSSTTTDVNNNTFLSTPDSSFLPLLYESLSIPDTTFLPSPPLLNENPFRPSMNEAVWTSNELVVADEDFDESRLHAVVDDGPTDFSYVFEKCAHLPVHMKRGLLLKFPIIRRERLEADQKDWLLAYLDACSKGGPESTCEDLAELLQAKYPEAETTMTSTQICQFLSAQKKKMLKAAAQDRRPEPDSMEEGHPANSSSGAKSKKRAKVK